MTIEELKANVLGRSSAGIPEEAINFALDYFRTMGKESYYATDVADCICLARKLTDHAGLVGAENRLVAELDRTRSAIQDACSFRDSMRLITEQIRMLNENLQAVSPAPTAAQAEPAEKSPETAPAATKGTKKKTKKPSTKKAAR